ncbi:MAG: EAL domain-containing protein [Actinomycetota bacterium]|nr:EAL domain-containing protein [Actinomycetota bacterium]
MAGSQEFLDQLRTGILLFDEQGNIFACNDATLTLFDATPEQLMGGRPDNQKVMIMGDDGAPLSTDELTISRILRTKEPCIGSILGISLPGKRLRWILENGYPLFDQGRLAGGILYVDDVSTFREERNSLRLLNAVNKIVLSATNETDPLQNVCDALVEHGPYALAWIGLVATDGSHDVVSAFASGTTGYLSQGMISTSGANARGRGPAGTAIRTGVSQVIGDLSVAEVFAPWRERAAQFGLRSCTCIPFNSGGRRAVLNLYAKHVHAFSVETVSGLEAIARELEFVITHIRSVQQITATLEEVTRVAEALRASENALSDSEERFRLAFENNMAPMVFSDINDRALAMNDAFCDMLGFSREELMGKDSRHFTHPEDIGITERSHVQLLGEEIDQVRYIKRYLRRDGRVIVSEVSRSTARDSKGRILYFVASERDVTAERALNEELSHKALHDSLTGLANRALFEDRLAQAHERAVRHGGVCAILMLDLDDFRGVNETHGHVVGDHLLVAMARRFEQVTRSADTICRFGGDEFLYLAEGLANEADVDEVAARLLGALSEPFVIDGKIIKQSASVGTVAWDGTVQQTDELLQNVDVALYESKRHRRGQYVCFDPTMHQLATSRFELLQELRHALEVGDISMHYQPIVDLSSTKVVGFEALMRWEHPERGPIPPLVFIPLAEQSDLIVDLGWFALREAVAAASSWGSLESQEGAPYVTVNLSAHQFHDPKLVGVIEQVLGISGLAPQRLIIEITESVTQHDIDETLETIGRLKEIGVSFALDDFGTGYSSLSYLALLKPLVIKIDKSFINPAIENEQHEILLGSIIQLGNRLGKVMLAEGIETRENLEHVRHLGCKFGQGYLFSRAVPCADAARLVGRSFADLVEETVADDS